MKNRNKDIKELEAKVNRLQLGFQEIEFDKRRPFTQKLISRFRSLYMLSKLNESGIKNFCVNLKGYKSIQDKKLFDEEYYLKEYSDVRMSGLDPLLHYMYYGFKEGRRPNPTFDSNFYLKNHLDVKNSDLNPLVHYSLYGINEKRKTRKSHENFKINEFKNSSQICESQTNFLKKSEPLKEISHDKNNLIGDINIPPNNAPAIWGWLAKRGDNHPLTAILKIDNEYSFEVLCNIFRADLKKNNINEGFHAFDFPVPERYVDGKNHNVQLIEKVTGKLIAQKNIEWQVNRVFNDFSGFLANSLVNPVINAPFREEDKRCFAMMENVAKHLSDLSDLSHNVEKEILVSIIMVAHNNNAIKPTVDSVLTQDYDNIELIIVYDGRDEATAKLLGEIKDKRVKLLSRYDDIFVISRARNHALNVACGKYVAYLDPPNMWDSRFLTTMIGAFVELSDAEAIYSGDFLFNERGSHPAGVRFGSVNKSLLKNKNYIALHSFCHTLNLYKVLSGFDESLLRYEDWDWILRIIDAVKVYSIPVILSNCYDNKTFKNDSCFDKYQEQVRKNQIGGKNACPVDSTPLKLKKGVSIIIPSYESLDDIKECIDSIFELNLDEFLEIIVVDNASSTSVVEYLDGLLTNHKISLIQNDINYGFTYAVNQGIEISKSNNDILVMNNDAILMPRSIEYMQKAAYELPQCGIVVPQQVLPGGTKTINIHVPYANPNYECDVNLSSHHNNIINVPVFHNGEILELSFAPFFCVYIKRDVLERSVGLDAEFGRHYRSDRIFCDYVRHIMNLKLYYVHKAKVYHKLQKSTQILSKSSDKNSNFNMIFSKNQWDKELAAQIGYKKAIWDI